MPIVLPPSYLPQSGGKGIRACAGMTHGSYTPSPLPAIRLIFLGFLGQHALVARNARLQGALPLGLDRCALSLGALRIGAPLRVRFSRFAERMLEGEVVGSRDVVAVAVENLVCPDRVGEA